jgi:hypothetical protein
MVSPENVTVSDLHIHVVFHINCTLNLGMKKLIIYRDICYIISGYKMSIRYIIIGYYTLCGGIVTY